MRINPPVFLISAVVIALFVAAGLYSTEWMNTSFLGAREWITDTFGWFLIASVSGYLIFAIYLMFSSFGGIKLGRDDDEPDFSYATWFAMLFSAGMGIGLVFFGVAEPLSHFNAPPVAEPRSAEAARDAMAYTFFHWGVHAWGIYIIVALSLAYFSFRHGLPLQIRSTLFPLLGERIDGPIGHGVEILAVFGTLFGLATSLGLGVQQINAGLEYLGLLESDPLTQVGLIAGITGAATISVVTGLGKGIRRLSELNLLLALTLLLFVLVAGQTVFLFETFLQDVGNYLRRIAPMSLNLFAYDGAGGAGQREWVGGWTLFYWAWWVSWAPFVGMFIARVSKGRTIREFISGVLFVPAVLTFVWFVVFGNSAIFMELANPGVLLDDANYRTETAMFMLLDKLPLSVLTSALAVFIVATFFVTSSDSGSLVIDILTSGGHPNPPTGQKVFWAVTEGAVAAILLWIGGSQALEALQAAAVSTGLPFAVVMCFMCWALYRGLRADRALRRRVERSGVKMMEEEPAE